MTIKGSRLALLDGLRPICALSVVAFHYLFQQGNPQGANPDTAAFFPALSFVKYGYLGVNIFFVISGFVVAFSATGQRPAVFAWHRWLRIYPTFVFCLMISAAAIITFGAPRFTVSAKEIVVGLILQSNALNIDFVDPVYWTISCEVWFYIFVFFGMLVPAVRRQSTPILACWLAISTIDQLNAVGGTLPGPIMTSYAALFCTGIFVYRVLMQSRSVINVGLLIYSVAFSLWLGIEQAAIRFSDVHTDYSIWPVIAILLVGVAAVAASARITVPAAAKALLFQIGGITYPLYLLHNRIGAIVINRSMPTIGPISAVLLATIASVVAAWITFAYVEPNVKMALIRAIWKLPRVAAFLNIRAPLRVVQTPPTKPIASEM